VTAGKSPLVECTMNASVWGGYVVAGIADTGGKKEPPPLPRGNFGKIE
jgi:hypothetical protein